MGDEVQAIKAGLLEVADLVVVNKGDRPGRPADRGPAAGDARADRRPRDERGPATARRPSAPRCWSRPRRPARACRSCSPRSTGTAPRGVDGATPAARRARAEAQVRAVLAERVWERLRDAGDGRDATDAAIAAVAAHELDPYAAADRLLRPAARHRRRCAA